MRRLMAQKIPIVSGSECAVTIMIAWGFFNKTVLAWKTSACQKPSYPLQRDHQLNNTTQRHFLCSRIAHGWHGHLSQIWKAHFFPALLRFFLDLHHGPHCMVAGMRLLLGPAVLDGGKTSRVSLLPCSSRKLCAHLCLLSHLCDGVTQIQFCKTDTQIIFFAFIKQKRQQLHNYIEQETSGTSSMQLKVTGNSQYLHPRVKQSCHLRSKMQAQPPSSSAWAFSYFPSSLQGGKIYLKGRVSQTSALLHHINQNIFSIWEYTSSG